MKILARDIGKEHDIVVITQADTFEGVTAAWVAFTFFKMNHLEEKMKWVEVRAGDPTPDVKDKDVLMFGVIFRKSTMLDLQAKAHSLVVFENGIESREIVSGLRFVNFDQKKTAGRMAYDFMRPHALMGNWLPDFTEDPQRWPWPHYNQTFLCAAVTRLFKPTLEDWQELSWRDPSALEMQGRDFLIKERNSEKASVENIEKPKAARGRQKGKKNVSPVQ